MSIPHWFPGSNRMSLTTSVLYCLVHFRCSKSDRRAAQKSWGKVWILYNRNIKLYISSSHSSASLQVFMFITIFKKLLGYYSICILKSLHNKRFGYEIQLLHILLFPQFILYETASIEDRGRGGDLNCSIN